MIEPLVKVTKITYNGSTIINEGWSIIDLNEYASDHEWLGFVIAYDLMRKSEFDNLGEFNGY